MRAQKSPSEVGRFQAFDLIVIAYFITVTAVTIALSLYWSAAS